MTHGVQINHESTTTTRDEKATCENCRHLNIQGRCPIFSLFHGMNWQLGYGVSCNKFKKQLQTSESLILTKESK